MQVLVFVMVHFCIHPFPLDMEMMFCVFSGPPSISAEQWLTYQVLGWLFSYGFLFLTAFTEFTLEINHALKLQLR